MKSDNKHLKVDKTTPEIRAYIYQQLNDIEHMIPKGSAIAISVDEDKTHQKTVSIILKTVIGDVIVNSQNPNIFTAIQEAKDDLEGQLTDLSSLIDEDDVRSMALDQLLTHKYLH